MAYPLVEPREIPTIFGEVLERNVAFCIDTSGSMYKGIDVVKEHLIETLQKHAKKSKPTMFNIIEFNSTVTQWADKMVTCTPQTVNVAVEWINKLGAKTGTNTKDALITALSDPLCEAVYLVTDGLPDQHPADILDSYAQIGRYRPVHCIYLSTEESTDSAAIEFLEDLAVESYGSFHIVTLTVHGCVERITPLFRADHAHERIIRTVNGTIRPQTQDCSVTTTLQVDPEESIELAPRVFSLSGYPHPDYHYPPYYTPYWKHWLGPYRYYYPYGWSRYRTAKGWLKTQEKVLENVKTIEISPAAGSLIINKKVFARRIEDGYFYLGTVKSQVLHDKFLVCFGPCKHGRYTETTYQDTFVFDIIDYDDAKRHAIQTSDMVLAPWEPEGERYCPGAVLEGHERRLVEGPDDKQLVVKFANGKTERVPADVAVWIPTSVYERLALELRMPKDAREALMSQENYPKNTLDGYLTSGPHADPEEYEEPDPIYLNGDHLLLESQPWRYPYFPGHPLLFRKKESTTSSKEKVTNDGRERAAKVVPGTSMTEKEIKEKVMSQLMEHKLVLDQTETEKETSLKVRTDLSEQERKFLRERLLELEEEKQERERILELQREIARLNEIHRLEDLEFKKQRQKQKESRETQYDKERLLAKRDKQEENTFKKSVSFSDESEEDIDRRKPKEDPELLELEKEIIHERQKQLEAEKEERERLLDIDGEISHLKGILRSERPREHTEEYRERLLAKRSKHEEDTLRRSVSFQDKADESQYDLIVEKMDLSEKESGLGTMERYTEQELQDRGVNTDSSLLFRPYHQPEGRPPWRKYWGSDPYKAVGAKMSAGSNPFRETAMQAPLEARNQSHPYIVEWTSPVYKYVDPYAKHDYSNSVELLLKTPKPPEKQSVAVETGPTLRPTHLTDEEKQAARREYRRKKINERQSKWDERIKNEDHVKGLMQDHHRERILAQIQREQERQNQEQKMVQQAREAKKKVSKEIREKIEKNQKWEADREQKRIEAMTKRREKREALEAQREKERAALEEKRKQHKMQHSQARWDTVHNRLEEEEADLRAKSQQYQNAKVMRIEHFHKLEEEGQRKKDLRIKVTDQHQALYRSNVLP